MKEFIISFRITKSYTHIIVGKYLSTSFLPTCRNLCGVQNATRQRRTQIVTGQCHKHLNISGRKATMFSLRSVTKLPPPPSSLSLSLSLPVSSLHLAKYILFSQLEAKSAHPAKFNQPASLSGTKDAGIRYQVTHFRPVTRDIPRRYAPLGTLVTSPVALLARKPIYHPNFARIIRCKRHTNGRLCAFGCHDDELVRLTPAG